MYRVEILFKETGELVTVWVHSNLELIDYVRRADTDGYFIFKVERNGLED